MGRAGFSFWSVGMGTNTTAAKTLKEKRRRMYARINILWKELRPDLAHSRSDLREGLLMFAEAELKKPQIGSFTELTIPELSRVCDALEREQKQPGLYQKSGVGSQEPGDVLEFKGNPKPAVASQEAQSAAVEHLASYGQRFAINRLFGYLGWSEFGREAFLKDRFRCKRVEMLLQKQAHSCIRILLNCAGSKYWKAQGKDKVSKPMIGAAIPKIKAEIGID
jgi:hypothetical protein